VLPLHCSLRRWRGDEDTIFGIFSEFVSGFDGHFRMEGWAASPMEVLQRQSGSSARCFPAVPPGVFRAEEDGVMMRLQWVIDSHFSPPYSKGVTRPPECGRSQSRQPFEEEPPSERNLHKTIRLISSSSLETCNISTVKPTFAQAPGWEPSDVAASWACCRASRGVTLRRAPSFFAQRRPVEPDRHIRSP